MEHSKHPLTSPLPVLVLCVLRGEGGVRDGVSLAIQGEREFGKRAEEVECEEGGN